MRNASFQHTQEQMRVGAAAARASADGYAGFVEGGKDVTRRLGWEWAHLGMFLCAVNKGQGFRPGERQIAFGVIEILDVSREPLVDITQHGHPIADTAREGFPELSALGFVEMFCEHMPKATARIEVARVVFRHVDVRRCRPALVELTPRQASTLGVFELWKDAA